MFAGQSPARVNIEEANKHLQMLYSRVSELEQTLAERNSAFEKRELELRDEYESIIVLKDTEFQKVSVQLGESQKKTSELADQIKLKDSVISDLQDKKRVLDEILQHRPMVENLLTSMSSVTGPRSCSNTSASDAKSQNQSFHNNILDTNILSGSKAPKLKEWPKPNIDLSPTITQMARNYRQNTKPRQFSISEDESLGDTDTIADDVFARPKPEKELYL